MFKINVEEKELKITRGDKGIIELQIPIDDGYYEFVVGDKIVFAVYEKEGLDKAPLLYLEQEVVVPGTTFDISLTKENTRQISPIINKEKEFWYEIELNGDQTVVGYDDDGPKILILWPEGKGKEND